MNTIDRYILAEFGRIFVLCMATLIAFYEMVVFMDYVGYFVKFHATGDMIFRYMLFKIPMALFHVTPICVLVASLLCMATLSRHGEITAMMACGWSLFRISLPVIAISMLIGSLAYLDSEHMFHLAAKETHRIYHQEIRKEQKTSLFMRDSFWYKSKNGDLWNIGHVNSRKRELHGVSIFHLNEQRRRISKVTDIESIRHVKNGWLYSGYNEKIFDNKGNFTDKNYPDKVFPEETIDSSDFLTVKVRPEEMNQKEIGRYVEDLKSKGYEYAKYEVEKYAKTAFPLISVVMPLIAIPMGIRSSRKGGVMLSIGVALAIGGLFWFVFSMGLAFGRAERLPPLLSAFGAHILFASFGLLMLTADRK